MRIRDGIQILAKRGGTGEDCLAAHTHHHVHAVAEARLEDLHKNLAELAAVVDVRVAGGGSGIGYIDVGQHTGRQALFFSRTRESSSPECRLFRRARRRASGSERRCGSSVR
ncbi:MAG: hypothetical protein WDN31_05160 [Hyphomicrobium sp.]